MNQEFISKGAHVKNRNVHLSISIILLILIGCTLTPPEKKEIKFVYQFEKGKVYNYNTSMENTTSGQMMGQEFTVTSNTNFDYSISPVAIDTGIYTLTATFNRFELKINMPMMGFIDSVIVMKEYIGKRVKIMMSDRGKTLNVEPIDTIAPSRLQMIANLTPSELFRHIVLEVPDKVLDTSVTWKMYVPDTTLRNGIKMVTKNNIDFKVVGREKKNDFDCWKISIKGTTSIEGSGSQRGNEITIDGNTTISGFGYLAQKEGLFVSSEQTNDVDMTTTINGAQTGASTMAIKTKMKTELVK